MLQERNVLQREGVIETRDQVYEGRHNEGLAQLGGNRAKRRSKKEGREGGWVVEIKIIKGPFGVLIVGEVRLNAG